jgi:hypothetical protein
VQRISAQEPDAVAAVQVDGGNDVHARAIRRKLSSSAAPVV